LSRPVGGPESADGPIGSPASADRPIGVFDSGVGGLSILEALRAELPYEHFVYYADTAHAPYGERSEAFVAERTMAVTGHLRSEHAIKALVIACNTATAAAVHLVREQHPNLPVVGVEPALKPAVLLTRTRRIGVMATRGTLASAKFRLLLSSVQGDAQFFLQPCDGLADAIERDDAAAVEQLCRTHLTALGRFGTAEGELDTLVLGCTHYPFARRALGALLPAGVHIVDTGKPVARHLRTILTAHGLERTAAADRPLTLNASGSDRALRKIAQQWLERPHADKNNGRGGR
jgi:glutamate racemase